MEGLVILNNKGIPKIPKELQDIKIKYIYFDSHEAYNYQLFYVSDTIYVSFFDINDKETRVRYENTYLIRQLYDYFSNVSVKNPEIQINSYKSEFELYIGGKKFHIISATSDFSKMYPTEYTYDLLIELHKQVLKLRQTINNTEMLPK